MKQTVTESIFRNAFRLHDRAGEFTSHGLSQLYEYLLSYENDSGEELELDVIALCCDFSEISIKDIEQETGAPNLEALQEETVVIYADDEHVLYQVF